jgi:DNA replication protein DnaC
VRPEELAKRIQEGAAGAVPLSEERKAQRQKHWEQFHLAMKEDLVGGWDLLEEVPEIEKGLRRAVGDLEIKCPLYAGSGNIMLKAKGKTTGLVGLKPYTCRCRLLISYRRMMHAMVPAHYADIKLKTLAVSPRSKLDPAVQVAAIRFLKENPEKNYAFFGPSGTSKTTYTMALLQHAIADLTLQLHRIGGSVVPSLWRCTAQTLLDQHYAKWDHRDMVGEDGERLSIKEPDVTVEKILAAARKGLRPCLFLEEIDKVRMTETRSGILFSIINAVFEHAGQIVINSNLTPEGLEAHLGEMQGATIPNRIMDGGGKAFNFFRKVAAICPANTR